VNPADIIIDEEFRDLCPPLAESQPDDREREQGFDAVCAWIERARRKGVAR
jgi:hypothetical protein